MADPRFDRRRQPARPCVRKGTSRAAAPPKTLRTFGSFRWPEPLIYWGVGPAGAGCPVLLAGNSRRGGGNAGSSPAYAMDATTSAATGLSEAEAAALLEEHGPNKLPEARPPSLPLRVARQLADPLSILLLVAGGVTLLVLREVPEGAAIVAILVVNVEIGVTQEVKAEQAVRSLGSLTAPMAKVRREGRMRRVPAAELVPGDVVEVAAGDRV